MPPTAARVYGVDAMRFDIIPGREFLRRDGPRPNDVEDFTDLVFCEFRVPVRFPTRACIALATFGYHVASIIYRSTQEEVARSDTGGVVAFVKDIQYRIKRAVGKLVGHAVRGHRANSRHVVAPVTALSPTSPNPASVSLFYLRPKALDVDGAEKANFVASELWGESGHSVVPSGVDGRWLVSASRALWWTWGGYIG